MRRLLPLLLCVFLTPALAAEPAQPWSTLSLGTCGVDEFAALHPEWDGRGVVVAILDSGVELNAPGLQTTSTGAPKVIDVQDFSGEGDLTYTRAEPGPDPGTVLIRDAEGRPIRCTVPQDPTRLGDHWYYTWFDENDFINSDIADFDNDGKTDTQLPILLAPFRSEMSPEPEWRAAFDRDQDRDFADEQWLADFWRHRDQLFLQRTRPEAQRTQITIALNIDPTEQRVTLHFDDGGHGTHVAGIAAGYQLNGHPTLHGVAPGAQVISLKIGNNSFAGGATTPGSKLEAFRYAARYALQHQVPVVCNLSYGIDSEREGASEIDRALQQLLEENPYLVVCTSAGNSGPGLSSIGTPAAAPSAITVAALLPQETARDGRGQPLTGHAVALFSSRGGDSLKPDICTPGYDTSTVPLWNRSSDFWQGTSMSSPYAAGLCARLLSAARATDPSTPVQRDAVKRALQSAAAPVPHTTALDTGAGVPHLPRAWIALQMLRAAQRIDDPSAIRVTTESPMGAGSLQTAYFRGLTVPREPQEFTLRAAFPPTTDLDTQESFFRRYTLEPLTDWALPVEESVYLRKTQNATIRVRYSGALLTRPGVHIGDIAVRAEGSDPSLAPDAILRSVICIPDRFEANQGDTHTWRQETALPNWAINRHWLYVPPYASAVRFRLSRDPNTHQSVGVRSLYLPNGHSLRTSLNLARDDSRAWVDWTWDRDLAGGVIELPITTPDGEASVPYDLRAELIALQATPGTITTLRGAKLGVEVQNLLEQSYQVTGTATLTGHQKTHTATLGGEDRASSWSTTIRLDNRYSGVRVRVRFPREDFLRFTDVHMGLYDSGGKALARDAMGSRYGEFSWTRSGRGEQTITFRLEPGFVEGWGLGEVQPIIEVESILAEQPTATIRTLGGEATRFNLPPGAPVPLTATFESTPSPAPSGMTLTGEVALTDARVNDVLLRIPIQVN